MSLLPQCFSEMRVPTWAHAALTSFTWMGAAFGLLFYSGLPVAVGVAALFGKALVHFGVLAWAITSW